ncbi:MAG: hypothetical protein KF819_00510 [Labilithrix sp.]|nr:hypothetical protein [Labilithrix sp.]
MARETHPPPSSGLPGRLPGLGRGRAIDFHGDPRAGASEAAPTAPHATPPPPEAKKSGPARFWRGRGVKIALNLALALSLVFHWVMAPWKLLPDRSGLELKDVDEELTIPVDLLGEDPPPDEKPAPPDPAITPPEHDPNGLDKRPDAGPPKPKPDASIDAEALATDAGVPPIAVEGGVPVSTDDGGSQTDAGESDAAGEGGLVASADASAPPGAAGPRDPGSMIGMAGIVTAGTVNVTLLVNIAVIRQNPVGARMGPILFGIPQWNDFVKGSNQTAIDPIRDTDWILIYGPSLIHTDRDAVFVHYSAPDAVVDSAVEAIAKRYDKGGPFDAGVPGVKASLGHADNAERVFMRVQPHVLVVVPKDKAADFAKVMRRAPISPKVRPGEAMRLVVKDPWKQISIPGLKFPNSLKEIRLWIVPRASDGGADLYVEGDCTDEAAASDVADAMTDLIKRQNSIAIRVATRGLLNNARVTPEGSQIKLHLSVSQEQLEALLQGVGTMLGVQVQPVAGGGR